MEELARTGLRPQPRPPSADSPCTEAGGERLSGVRPKSLPTTRFTSSTMRRQARGMSCSLSTSFTRTMGGVVIIFLLVQAINPMARYSHSHAFIGARWPAARSVTDTGTLTTWPPHHITCPSNYVLYTTYTELHPWGRSSAPRKGVCPGLRISTRPQRPSTGYEMAAIGHPAEQYLTQERI